jgi:hypothetical protein
LVGQTTEVHAAFRMALADENAALHCTERNQVAWSCKVVGY